MQRIHTAETLLKSPHESMKFKFLNFTASVGERNFGRHNMRKGRGRGTLPQARNELILLRFVISEVALINAQ